MEMDREEKIFMCESIQMTIGGIARILNNMLSNYIQKYSLI